MKHLRHVTRVYKIIKHQDKHSRHKVVIENLRRSQKISEATWRIKRGPPLDIPWWSLGLGQLVPVPVVPQVRPSVDVGHCWSTHHRNTTTTCHYMSLPFSKTKCMEVWQYNWFWNAYFIKIWCSGMLQVCGLDNDSPLRFRARENSCSITIAGRGHPRKNRTAGLEFSQGRDVLCIDFLFLWMSVCSKHFKTKFQWCQIISLSDLSFDDIEAVRIELQGRPQRDIIAQPWGRRRLLPLLLPWKPQETGHGGILVGFKSVPCHMQFIGFSYLLSFFSHKWRQCQTSDLQQTTVIETRAGGDQFKIFQFMSCRVFIQRCYTCYAYRYRFNPPRGSKRVSFGLLWRNKRTRGGQIRQSEEKFLGATNTTRFSQLLDGQVRPASFEGSRSCIAGKKL